MSYVIHNSDTSFSESDTYHSIQFQPVHAQPEKHIYTLKCMPISPDYNNTLTPPGSRISFADLCAPDVAQVLPKRHHDLYFIYTFHVVSLDSFTPFQPIVESLIVTPSFYLAAVPTTKKHLSP